jgi:hypothetical protein
LDQSLPVPHVCDNFIGGLEQTRHSHVDHRLVICQKYSYLAHHTRLAGSAQTRTVSKLSERRAWGR